VRFGSPLDRCPIGLYPAPSVVVFRWTCEQGQLICHKTVLRSLCDWSEVDALCTRLSPLLDRHDRDRFAYLLRYGT
jgi:hypothetical protein